MTKKRFTVTSRSFGGYMKNEHRDSLLFKQTNKFIIHPLEDSTPYFKREFSQIRSALRRMHNLYPELKLHCVAGVLRALQNGDLERYGVNLGEMRIRSLRDCFERSGLLNLDLADFPWESFS